MRRVLYCWATAWVLSTLVVYFVFKTAPNIDDPENRVKVPSNFEEVQALAVVLAKYAKKNQLHSMFMYAVLVIYLKTFALLGRETLTIVSGALYGLQKGLLLSSAATVCGAACCYFLAYMCLEGNLEGSYHRKLRRIRRQVATHRDNAFWYLLSLILVPFIPNPLVASACLLAGVPLSTLLLATAIGTLPLIYVEVSAGVILAELKSGRVVNAQLILLLLALSLLIALPTYYYGTGEQEDDDEVVPFHPTRVRVIVPGYRVKL